MKATRYAGRVLAVVAVAGALAVGLTIALDALPPESGEVFNETEILIGGPAPPPRSPDPEYTLHRNLALLRWEDRKNLTSVLKGNGVPESFAVAKFLKIYDTERERAQVLEALRDLGVGVGA